MTCWLRCKEEMKCVIRKRWSVRMAATYCYCYWDDYPFPPIPLTLQWWVRATRSAVSFAKNGQWGHSSYIPTCISLLVVRVNMYLWLPMIDSDIVLNSCLLLWLRLRLRWYCAIPLYHAMSHEDASYRDHRYLRPASAYLTYALYLYTTHWFYTWWRLLGLWCVWLGWKRTLRKLT